MGKLQIVKIENIRENKVALRNVNLQSEDYLGLVESIRSKGFMGAITVRTRTDEATGEVFFELVDGLHRLNAARDAGLTEINVDVLDLDDMDTLQVQLMANVHKIETRPMEYSQQIRRILMMNSMMTEAELATTLGKSPAWIQQRLGLNKIDNEVISTLINEGKIGLSNAYALAKLPAEEMADFSDRAQTTSPDEFIPQVEARVKEIRDANRKGKKAAPSEFIPTAFLQKLSILKDELEDSKVGTDMINRFGLTTAQEGWDQAIKFVLHMDQISVEQKKAEWEQKKAERDAARARRAEERKAAKEAQAAEEAAAAAEAA